MQTNLHERNLALQALHKRIIHSQVNKNLMTSDLIVSIIMEEPAPRFYIEPAVAKQMITRYYDQGKCACAKRKQTLKQEMAKDLVENYERLRAIFPHTPKEKIYEMVVEQPAKSFYMSYRNVRDVIFNYTGRKRKSPK